MVRQQFQRSINLDHCRNTKIELVSVLQEGEEAVVTLAEEVDMAMTLVVDGMATLEAVVSFSITVGGLSEPW